MKRKYYGQGSITVFLSLVLVLLISIVCQVVEEAVFQADRMKVASSSELAFQGLLGEYNLELLENYGLLFLDASDENGNLSKDKLLSRLDYYMYRNIENTGGMLRMELLEEEITALTLATDKEGQPYYREVVEAYKPLLGKVVLEEAAELLEDYQSGKKKRETVDKSKVTKEELKIPEDLEVDKEAKKKAEEIENPIDTVEAIRENGGSNLLTFGKSISGNRIDLSTTIGYRKLDKGNYDMDYENSATDEIIFNLYLKDMFTNFRTVIGVEETGGLLYQQEYIVGGKASDIENLAVVIEKILWLREGVNFVYLLTDKVKMAEADALATALVGYTGIVPLIAATKMAILAVWAYGESLVEVGILLNGGKVDFIKTTENWHLSLSQLAQVDDYVKDSNSGDRVGMAYEDFLWLFLSATSKKDRCYRSMDIIEQNIQKKSGVDNFRMDHCVYYVGAEISVNSRMGRTIQINKGMGY